MAANGVLDGVLLQRVALTVVFTWLANQTRGSVLLAMLLHASFNTTVSFAPIAMTDWYATASGSPRRHSWPFRGRSACLAECARFPGRHPSDRLDRRRRRLQWRVGLVSRCIRRLATSPSTGSIHPSVDTAPPAASGTLGSVLVTDISRRRCLRSPGHCRALDAAGEVPAAKLSWEPVVETEAGTAGAAAACGSTAADCDPRQCRQ